MRLLIVLSITFSLTAWGQRSAEFHCDARDCVIPYDSEGFQNGLEICYTRSEKKEKIKEVSWVKGKRQGPAKCFKNDRISTEANYENDELSGLFIEHNYDSNGDKIHLVKNGLLDGPEFSVNAEGKVTVARLCYDKGFQQDLTVTNCQGYPLGKFQEPMNQWITSEKQKIKDLAQKMDGPQVTKHSNGKVKATYTMNSGKLDGRYQRFNQSGILVSDCLYKHDKLHGPCLTFADDGRKKAETTFDMNKMTSEDLFFDNGKFSQKTTRKDPQTLCRTEFSDNGMKVLEYCFMEYGRSRQGPYTAWETDGKKYLEGIYVDGKRIGEWKSYWKGQLSQVTVYQKDILTSTMDYIYEGVPHRIFREYFPDGSIKKEERYEGLEGSAKGPQI